MNAMAARFFQALKNDCKIRCKHRKEFPGESILFHAWDAAKKHDPQLLVLMMRVEDAYKELDDYLLSRSEK